MSIINLSFTNLMHLSFPIFVYLLYVCYKKGYNQKENDLAVVLTIISMLYVVLKFNSLIFEGIPFMVINLALIMAFFKKSKLGILISSIGIITYYYLFYKDFLIILILVYIVYYLIYLKINNLFKVNVRVTLIHTLLITVFTLLKFESNHFSYFYQVIFESFCSFLVINLVIYVISRAETILKLYMSHKELVREKQIKNSLFQITHEIKNPIAVCKGYLDMFDVNNKNHAKKYIPIMKEEITRTLYLLEDFLAMNKVKIQKEIIDINMLLEEVSNRFIPMLKENKIEFEANILDDEIYILGDYNRLTQVFINIFKNSIEAIDKKGKIKLWTQVKDNKVIINIKDNGIGISKEDMKHIKEAFYTTKVRGTGLGVSLSNEIILAHGGKLEYVSKEGEYTLVTVSLPLEKLD